jgi:hypothetical protein
MLLEKAHEMYDADEQTARKRCRLLPKQYHPNAGGSQEDFAIVCAALDQVLASTGCRGFGRILTCGRHRNPITFPVPPT